MPDCTLITGASGFIGAALVRQLSKEYSAPQQCVVCIARNNIADEVAESSTFVQGEFHSLEDLRQLDNFNITCVVHLAAATGGCSEEEGLAVNVVGTSRLLRYALDRGCRKFILASSIAAVGCLSPQFVPLQIPIPDEHPCLAQDAYGLSKAMVEEMTRYFQRVFPDSEFIHLRFGAVDNPAVPPPLYTQANAPEEPFVLLAHVALNDVLQALTLAMNASLDPGVHIFNVVAPQINADSPVPVMLRAALGKKSEQLDMSWYECPEQSYSALYATDKIIRELGFKPSELQHTSQ